MSTTVSKWRMVALLAVIILFVVTVFSYALGGQLFHAAAVPASIFGLAGVMLVVLTMRVHELWPRRTFFLLTGISAAGIPLSVLLYDLACALCIRFLGEGFWTRGSDEPFFFIWPIAVFPALFVVGTMGSLGLLERSKPYRPSSEIMDHWDEQDAPATCHPECDTSTAQHWREE